MPSSAKPPHHAGPCQAVSSHAGQCQAMPSCAVPSQAVPCRAGGWVTSGSRLKGAGGLSAPSRRVCPAVPGQDGCCSHLGIAGVGVWRGERKCCRAGIGAGAGVSAGTAACSRAAGLGRGQVTAVPGWHSRHQCCTVPGAGDPTLSSGGQLGTGCRVLRAGWQGGLRGSRLGAAVTPRAGGQGSSGAGLWVSSTVGVPPPEHPQHRR